MDQAPLLYFVTGTAQAPAHATEPGFTLPSKAHTVGPSDAPGRLLTPCRMLCDLEYAPERQKWVKTPRDESDLKDAGDVWIGVDPGAPLRPELLARADQRKGHAVELGRGGAWMIPVARMCAGGTGLPRRRVLDEAGKPCWQVEEAYRGLTDYAENLWNVANGGGTPVMDELADRICGEALAVNYRIGMLEAIALGLFTDAAMRGMLRALIDMPTVDRIIEAQKKSRLTAAG